MDARRRRCRCRRRRRRRAHRPAWVDWIGWATVRGPNQTDERNEEQQQTDEKEIRLVGCESSNGGLATWIKLLPRVGE
jgi:hypothetical protein